MTEVLHFSLSISLIIWWFLIMHNIGIKVINGAWGGVGNNVLRTRDPPTPGEEIMYLGVLHSGLFWKGCLMNKALVQPASGT
jgi:hypothetical protein